MCDCFHLAFPNWHAASSGTGAGRRLRGPEPGTEDDSICDGPSHLTEEVRPRPQGSSPVEEYPETDKFTDSDKECEAEHDPRHKSGSGKKTKKSGRGSMFEKRSTPKMSKLKEVPSPDSEVIVKTAKDGCAEGLIYGGGGKEGIFIKEVVPESPASKSLKLKEGDQILSATVYFDNMSYEDAIQILEHAQAYNLKLCLKRKPDITETEPAMDSDVIPEEDLGAPEMREQGKTKRRGDARISWPKFPSFGKGRKSRFTRSHSSSEADEQRKLELSPTTSDTESPIKSQDALKGKKRHKMKLSSLKKRGRISSSEDQETDAPTTGQISGDIYQTASDMLSPDECIESLSGEAPEVYVSKNLKVVEEIRLEQNDPKMNVQHKVELISIDSTLKTADLTMALADQESPSVIKSPNEKKKKKERSELKFLGKDKSHKKDAKAKASPKRLKTLGASTEVADQPANEKSDVIPKVELDFSDVKLIRRSPQKGEEQAKKDIKQKQEAKTGLTFKLPKIGLSDISTEESIQKLNIEECPTKIEKLNVAVKEDPYDRLSKSSHSRTQLPKREDIEIPGMEDMSVRTRAKGIKVPKVVLTGQYEEFQTETVQLSIDVDSVKEAVSKLPGFKLPKVDICGMPIPEEITVIDANAQRISVKTPTKVADTKSKREAHLTKFDITACSEISKTTVKLPKITTADSTSEELLIETKVVKETEKVDKTKPKQSDKEMKMEFYKREDITIPGKESVKKDIVFKLPKQNIFEQQGGSIFGERTILLQEVTTPETETRKGKGQIGGVISDVKIPEIDTIEYIDSADGSPAKKGGGISLTGFGVNLNATKPKADISFPETGSEVKDFGAKEHTIKLNKFGAVTPNISVNVPDVDNNINIDGSEVKILQGEETKFKMPNFGISIPKLKGSKTDSSLSKKDATATLPETKAGVKLPEATEIDVSLGSIHVSIPEQKVEVPELEMKPLQTEVELDGQGSKFKMPKFGIKMPKIKGPEFDLSLSKKDVDVTLPEAKAGVKLPEAPEVDITIGGIDVSIPEQKVEVEKPELKIRPLQTEVDIDGQGSRFKMPKFGIKMPKMKGPEFDSSLSKKDIDVTLPEAKAGVKLPEAPEVDVTIGGIDVSIPEQKVEVEKPELKIRPLQTEVDIDGQGSRFKMPKFGIKMPKMKGPEFDLSLSKKDVDVTLPEAKAGVKLPEAPEVDITIGGIDVSIPEQKVEVEKPELKIRPLQTEVDIDGQGSRFKMPKFGIKMPKMKGPEFDSSLSKKDIDVTLPEAKAGVKLPEAPEVDVTIGGIDVSIPEQKVEVEKPELKIRPLQTEVDIDGQGSRFKMPKFGIKMPKMKGPEFDLSLSKKDVDVTLPEAKAGVKLPEAPEVDITIGGIDVSIPEQKVEVEKPELKIRPLQTEVDIDGQGSRFKMPKFGIKMPKIKGPEFDSSLSKKDIDVTLPEAKAGVKLPEAPEVDVTIGGIDVSIPEQKVEVEKPELKIRPLQTEVDIDGQGSRFKMPKFGIKMPKMKGPEFDLSLSKKDIDVTLPEAKAGVKLPEAPNVEATLGSIDVSIPVQKMEVKTPELQIKPLQTDGEHDGQGSKFKMPELGITMPKVRGPEIDFSLSKKDVAVSLPAAKVEPKLPHVELKGPSAKVEIKAPEIKGTENDAEESPSKFKMPSLKLPKFGATTPNVSIDVSKKTKDIQIPETQLKSPEDVDTVVEITAPNIDIVVPSLDVKTTAAELDGKGIKFKMPKFGRSTPKVKSPEIDLSSSKKDIHATLPKAEAEFNIPDIEHKESGIKVEVKAPEIAVHQQDVEGSPSKFKMPTFKLPKFGVGTPNISMEVSDRDKNVKIDGADINSPVEGSAVSSVDIEGPSLDMKTVGTDHEGKGSTFKMPNLGFSVPKVKGPQINLVKKDGDDTLQGVNVEVEIPKTQKVDVSLGKADVSIPEEKLEVKKPDLDTIPLLSEVELDGQGSKFKMPKLGMSMPQVKGPEIHFSLSKRDEDVTLPEAEVEVTVPKVELQKGFAEVEAKAPEIKVAPKSTESSPLKFKMPTFKLPKFGVGTAKISVEGPDMDKDVKIDGADIKIPKDGDAINITAPSVEGPSIDLKSMGTEKDDKGSKFKMPHLGISMPKGKGHTMDLSLSKKDGDVTFPEAKAEVKLPEAPKIAVEMKSPECEAEIDRKCEEFNMPKFGMSMPKVKGPEFHLGFSKKDVNVTLPEAKADVNLPDVELKEPSAKVEIKAPAIKVAAKDTGGSPSKFKMPSFSFSKPKVKGPVIDLSLSKKDTDITLQDTNAEVKLPEAAKIDVSLGKAVLIPEAKTEVKKPEVQLKPQQTDVELEGQGGKFKMPTFGITMPKVKGPDIDLSFSKKDVDATKAKAEVKTPETPKITVDVKSLECEAEIDGQGSKFNMPKFGISMPKVKGPGTDLSSSKKDVDVILPEAKAEVKLPDVELKDPSAKVEIKPPETEAQLGHMEGSPLKFKLPTFKLPKFGTATPNISGKVPDIDKDIEVVGAGLKIQKDNAQNINIEGPSLEVKMTAAEGEGKGSKFKVPNFGISMPKVQGPKIDLSVSKKDVDVKLTEAKADVELKAPEIHVNLGKAEVSIPEAKMEVQKPELEIKHLETEGKLDGQGSKFKMPKFGISMPKVKGPEIDFSVSKDGDVSLPEAKAEIKLPDVELKEHSAKVEVKAPEIEAQSGSMKGSPSKFKMPTFKFPKFGVPAPNVSAEIPDTNKEIKIEGAHMHISAPHTDIDVPEVKGEVYLPGAEVKEPLSDVAIEQQSGVEVDEKMKKPRFSMPKFSFSKQSVKAPEVDLSVQDVNVSLPEGKVEVKGGEVDMKSPEHEAEVDGQGSKFKMPKFGISMPKVTGPDMDLSLSQKDVDVTIPEAKAEVKLPDVDLKEPSAEVEIKPPEIKVVTKDKEGSPSKFKMPTFKFPKFGVGTPTSIIEVPDMDKDVKINGADINSPEEVLTVHIVVPSIDTEGQSMDLKTTTTGDEEKGSKFKLPKFGISMPKVTGPDIDLSLSKKDVDVTIPEAKAEVKLPDVDLKEPSVEVEIKPPEIKVVTKDTEGSPSKFKMPTFKFPKFGVGTPTSTIEVPDKDVKINGADINIPEEVLAVHIVAPSIDTEGKSMDLKTTGHEEKGSKFKMPSLSFSVPQVKGPDIDSSLSKTAVDVTIPEATTDVQLPDVELKEPSAKVEIKAPGIEVHTSNVEGSPSKFKMPTFKLPKFGAATPQVSVEVPDLDKDIKVDGSDLKLPEAKAEVTLPDVEIKEPVDSISVSQASIAEGDAKLKKPRFSLPKFSFSKQSTKELDVRVPEVDVSLPEGNVEVIPSEGDVEVDGLESKFKMPKFGISMPKVKGPDIDLSFSKKDVNVTQTKAKVEVEIPEGPKIDVDVKPLDSEAETDGQGGKFKMPKFGISMAKVKGPEIDLSLTKKDFDVTLPEAKAEVQLTDVEIKQPSGKVDAKAPEIKGQTGNVEGSPLKLKIPTFTLPKFGAATPKVSVQVPDVDKDIKIDGAKMEIPKEGAIVNVTAPSIDAEGLSVDVKAKESELEGSESRFKMPKFGISMPKVKGPEIDLSLSNKDGDVTLPEAITEVTLPSVEVKEPKGAILVPDAPTVETEAKLKRPNWTFPKFSFSRTSGKASDVDVNLETPKADVTTPEVKEEISLPEVEVKGPSGIISMEEPPSEELDGNLKKSKFSLPKFSFSKSSAKMSEVSAELPRVDVFLPEGEVRVRQPGMEIKAPELEAEHDVQGSKFKLPKFGISLPKSEGPEVDLNASQKDVDVTLPHVRAEVKLPEAEVKESSARVETEAKSKDVGGSPSKFKMPTLKMPKFGGASYDITVEAPGADKAENYGAQLEDVTVKIKGPSVDIKTDTPKAVISDSETPKTETDSMDHGSPSRFKLPLFKMPKLGFSKTKPEDECVPADSEGKDNQLETEEESKSPKLTLTSFGEILKNFDVEFEVSKTDDNEENLKAIKEVDETSGPGGKQIEEKEKETQSNTKQDTSKSPEKTSWFKFPKFGLSSPSEPAKISEKDEHKDEKTPVDETGDEEISPTSSIQSSDAFADVSSTVTSEYFCPSASSPTKVTAKYSAPGIEETHTNIVTSTTRTALISVEPNMPEKITILSSGVSSSSEDTLKLESGKIHVITTNIQATPEAQHAKLLTAVQVQSAEGFPLQTEDREAASWTVEDSQSGKRRVFERHFVRETSNERSESKETIVITKQITHIFDSSEPISGETASSIQRLKDSVHSEKMRFFDGAEK